MKKLEEDKKPVPETTLGNRKPAATGEEGERIWVHEFDEVAAQKFCSLVLAKAEENEQEPIVIYVDSYGGYVDGLASMLGVLDSVPNPVITIATGKAMSAGAILLSHGNVRCVGPHARVMIHEISGAAWGNINDIVNETRETERMNQHFGELLARNCGMSLKKLQSRLRGPARELYLSPQEAVRFGVADQVGIPRVDIHTGFQLKFIGPKPSGKNNGKKKK